MSQLISFGEVLIDWIPLGSQKQGSLDIPLYGQFPGGAPANVAVALAKLGGKAYFLGKIGEDPPGKFLRKCLNDHDVDTSFLLNDAADTPMAFVSLDADGERSFAFHRHATADMQYTKEDFPTELFSESIFHICSNTLTDPSLKETTLAGLILAQNRNCLTSFDVNLRFPLWGNIDACRPAILEAIAFTDLLKLSLEEFEYLANGRAHALYIEGLLQKGPKVILLTDGPNAVKIYQTGQVLTVDTPKVTAVDTTGAGDAFVGGWLSSLLQDEITSVEKLTASPTAILKKAATYAVQCGAFSVTKQGAWSALPRQKDIQL